MTRKLVVGGGLALVIFLVAANPARAQLVASNLLASLESVGRTFGDFIGSFF